ncbi:unnamed protein product [Prorocentrum cordatum]|uniref:Uncharacterized protein n=1 Tax=Prorocentrum cordatum TaxID=2364126 RepID=A0ABN9TIP3_9DINO|nr:unnamed protein product [Polarella glacialis]
MHRGFGFGVFEDPGCVDRWLMGERSRFMRLSRGGEEKQLEVKRAVSSEDMHAQSQGGAPPNAVGSEPGACPDGRGARQTPARWPGAAAPWAAVPALPLGRGGAAGDVALDGPAHALALLGPHLFVDEAHRRRLEAVLKQAQPEVYED